MYSTEGVEKPKDPNDENRYQEENGHYRNCKTSEIK